MNDTERKRWTLSRKGPIPRIRPPAQNALVYLNFKSVTASLLRTISTSADVIILSDAATWRRRADGLLLSRNNRVWPS